MNKHAEVRTIKSLNDAAANAELRLLLLAKDAPFTEREAAKQALRKAKEDLRVFIYKAKGTFNARGRSLRH